jgi:hypothetical protein
MSYVSGGGPANDTVAPYATVYLIIVVICVCLFGALKFGLHLKGSHEQRIFDRQQQIEEVESQIRQDCRIQYPHDVISRSKCYDRVKRSI